jgi:hypothetical protein
MTSHVIASGARRITSAWSRLRALSQRPGVVRGALLLSLVIAWVNFIGTVKWAHLPGALNGPKRWYYGSALLAATVFACLPARIGAPRPSRLRLLWMALFAGTLAYLGFVFLSVFPLSTWSQVPFQDDWPPRLQATLDGVELLRRGVVNGWQWNFLGGYHTSSNLSQTLSVLSFLPVTLLGPAVGFHLLHGLMPAVLPLLLFWELRQDGEPEAALVAGAFGAITAAGLFGTIMPSGDTNSIAGVACAAVALAASHAARLGRWWGWPLLILALCATLYSHAAFFLYAAFYLLLEAIYYRDLRCAWRSAVSLAVAVLAGTPLFWEMVVYRGYTDTNNVAVAGSVIGLMRQVYYNTEILAHPHRWFNDYVGLTEVFLPVIAVASFGRRSRAGFYAVCTLGTVALLRLNASQFGYLLTREMHMLAYLVPPALAGFVVHRSTRRALAVSLAAVVCLYVHTETTRLPHVDRVQDFNPHLVQQVSALDGNLVLIENSPHRDMDLAADRRSVRTRFPAHFEALLPAATGKRFYGSEWDGWVWSSYRRQVVAGGTFAGQAISTTPPERFVGELHRWGIRHLAVWSEPTVRYLTSLGAFDRRWSQPPWTLFELRDADARSVVTNSGTGSLGELDALGGVVRLRGVKRGDRVLVRMNFYPAWRATCDGRPVPLRDDDGQVAFSAPADGDLVVRLEYPRYGALNLFVACVLLASLALTCLPAVRRRLRGPRTEPTLATDPDRLHAR